MYTITDRTELTHHAGVWSWNAPRLMSKIACQGEPIPVTWLTDPLRAQVPRDDRCWTWQGSQGPYGALFGAVKNQQRQMTQARRLIYQTVRGLDLGSHWVRQTCHNRFCCNPSHMQAVPAGEKYPRILKS